MFPSEAIAYIILGQEDVRDPRVEVWFMAPHPHNLRGGESGQDGIPGELDHPFGTDPLGDPRALLGGALVVPQNCGPENTTSPIQRHEPMHLPGQPYGCDVTLPNAYLVQNPTYAVTAASHHVVGSCSVHPGRGVSRGYSVVATAATCPAESRSTAFAPVVPTSIPNSRGLPDDPGPTAGALIIEET